MNKNEFDDFFKPYSKNVDNANTLAFWKLSDAIILEIIKKNIPTNLNASHTILDAGGGTGRWICDLSKVYGSNFILYDLSKDMLEVAKKNFLNSSLSGKVKIVNGPLENMQLIPDNSVDYIISIYSPISFIYEKLAAAKELFRILKKGGKIIIMGHGFYNAIASKINNYNANPEELSQLSEEMMVKWANHVPKLNTFSRESMEDLLGSAGFKIISTYGVPVFTQPGGEDFDFSNSRKSKISLALENISFFKKVLEMEMLYNNLPSVSNRGMNIFTAAEK